MAKATTKKSNVRLISNQEPKTKTTARSMSDVKLKPHTETDRPEYIKSGELSVIYPFTIYKAEARRSDLGERIFFWVAFKNSDDETIKRIWTPTSNEERAELMREVKKGPIINCRLIEVPTNGRYDYFKVIGIDDDAEQIIEAARLMLKEAKEEKENNRDLADEDIPF